MKRLPLLLVSLLLPAILLFFSLNQLGLAAAGPALPPQAEPTAAPDSGVPDADPLDVGVPEPEPAPGDPEPPLLSTTPLAAPDGPEAISAVLEPAWTAPVSDFTNSLAWGDYDLDGDLDLVVGNYGSNRVYRNEGGTLVEIATLVCDTSMPTENTYGVAWADYDLDGDLDIAIGNHDGKNCVYRYEAASDTFVRAWRASQTQNTRSVAWAGWEYDGEYVMYLAVGNANEPNAVYKYETGSFELWWTDQQDSVTYSLDWGDYDNDGDPDLAIANFGPPNVLYSNEQSTLIQKPFPSDAMYSRDVSWGDMNGDGYLDLAFANGQTSGIVHKDQVYCNNGPEAEFTFSLCWTSDDASPSMSVSWGDYEGDGDLDLAITSESGGNTRVYVNKNGMLEVTPRFSVEDEYLTSRDAAWGDWDGDGDLELAIGYYQSPSVVYQNTAGVLNATDFGPEVLDTRSLAWGDVDGDGDLDLAVGNSNATPNNVYLNDSGVLTLAWSALSGNNTNSVAWGDIDGDGDLDLGVGNGENASGRSNQVYLNTGGNLTLLGSSRFLDPFPSNTYAVAWGDYDGDQDLDLATANYGNTQPNRIHINRRGSFTQTLTIGPASDQSLSLAWGDFDQDYDLDLLVGNYNGPARVYVNNGSGAFSTVTLPTPADSCLADARGVAWVDYDSDGDLDVSIGNGGATGCVVLLKAENMEGAWSFVPVWQSTDANLDIRSLAWGDYDGDGDPDLAVGINEQFGGRNLIYRNTAGSLTRSWTAPYEKSDPTRSVAWGDYDGDGDLDLAVGNALSPNKPNRVYVNTWNNSTNLANDPIRVKFTRPDESDEAWFFSSYRIVGSPFVPITYDLYDDEGDSAFYVEVQVSWDGGGRWEPAWEVNTFTDFYGVVHDLGSEGNLNLAATPGGFEHVFYWDALHQLLDHQGIPFDPESGIYVPFGQSFEEMDVAFRIVAWSNPEHGGQIQRPTFGTATTIFRVDMRPDWSWSRKTVEPKIVHPGETVDYSLVITQTDQGMPPSYIIDKLPPELKLWTPAISNRPTITNSNDTITWTWNLNNQAIPKVPYDVKNSRLIIDFSPVVTRPLDNKMLIDNCAMIFDGLHAPFDRCVTFEISSTPVLTTSWKLVNGQLGEAFAMPGDLVTYTVILTNTGTMNAYNAVLTDTLPAHLNWLGKLKASSGTVSFDEGLLTWLGEVRVFKPVTITYVTQIEKPLPGNTVITNTFWLSDGINKPFVPEPTKLYVLAPDLRTSVKLANMSKVEQDDILFYTVVLSNTGVLNASPVDFLDLLPDGVTYVKDSFMATSGVGAYVTTTESITWTGVVPVDDEVLLSFAVKVGIPSKEPFDKLINRATAVDELSGEVTMVHTATLMLPKMTGSFKSAFPSRAELSSPITYTVVLSNTGGLAPRLKITDPLPENSKFVSGSLGATHGSAGYQSGTRTVTWQGSLAYNEPMTLTFTVSAGCPVDPATPVIANTAKVEGTLLTPITLSANTPISLPNLSTTTFESSSLEVIREGEFTYTMVIRNTGGFAPLVRMTDVLPQDLIWLDTYTVSRGALTYDSASRQVRWEGSLARNEFATITFTVKVKPNPRTTEISNIAELWNGCTQINTAAVLTKVRVYTYLPVVLKKN